ncbi:UvrD-helicase domain-containing protein [Paenibacillus sp. FSL K6-3166]|uniref:UvrD-helicase domain-containing protein n=1 Tax=unclassified Paenibacillus TaxID=185978 RepID=UPI000BA148DB|nr:UvrD-helicase domain-containing protein [Paenibacillus sp. VTT E-133291]OZQ85398.1 hypothetical protein CA598_20975 [Paenibacillus sp. VTT E-133291]
MLNIVRSEQCSRCGNETFELIKVDEYGSWLRCHKCQLQRTSHRSESEIIEDLKREEKRKKAEERERLEECKREAKKMLILLFEADYLSSKRIWFDELSSVVSEEDFIKLSAEFVISWFEKQRWKTPDWEQAKCIAEVWSDVQVVARAGSGKTATTVNRAAFLVKHCRISPSEILLLAFNREAAKEVSDRLSNLLGGNAPQAMTFHALAYAIVHPEEALIYDDDMSGFEKSTAVQQVIDSFLQDKEWGKRIEKLMIKYFREDWNNITSGGYNLSPEEMVTYRRLVPNIGLDGKYYKSLGEKSIANYLFEHEVPYAYEKNFKWGGTNYRPDFTIPIYNNDKKGIIIEYFGIIGDKAYDIQTSEKRKFWENNKEYYYIELFPGHDLDHINSVLIEYGILGRKLTDLELWHRIKNRALDEFSVIVSQFISRCRKLMISPEDLVGIVQKNNNLPALQIDFLRVIWKIYQEYLRSLTENNLEDFDGLLMRSIEVVNSERSRWQRKLGSGDLKKIKYLFIDEYQDFSLLFYQLISAIKVINKGIKLFCVGDDWQAINGFAGSDLRFFNEFLQYFPNSKQFKITSNYRSSRKIVMVANQVMIGHGTPSKASKEEIGNVWVANINQFIPTDLEFINYSGDIITPILIRLVYSFTMNGQKVALLSRKGTGLPWYTPYDTKKGKLYSDIIKVIRNALPEEMRSLVVNMDTAHSFKGKEEDVIIVVDAVESSYPLLHPSNVFFEVLGRTLKDAISEEKRLFYVALSRAKKAMVILTEYEKESPFLPKNIKQINLNILKTPSRNKAEASRYLVKIQGKTFELKSYFQESKYRWNSADKSWIKQYAANQFTKEVLLKERWISVATDILIIVTDEFENMVTEISVREGQITILRDSLNIYAQS